MRPRLKFLFGILLILLAGMFFGISLHVNFPMVAVITQGSFEWPACALVLICFNVGWAILCPPSFFYPRAEKEG